MEAQERRPPPAVVLAADINGLGVVRSLHSAGVPTIAVATDARDPLLRSRLPVGKWLVPAAPDAEQALLDTLTLIAGERPVLIPTSDAYMAFMLKHREALAQHFAFCLPSRPRRSWWAPWGSPCRRRCCSSRPHGTSALNGWACR
jgi:predicted ATP-grasp superfamily ATP-dependent carboligase